jgi:hypothetical protein
MRFLVPKGVSSRVPPRLVRSSRLLIIVGLLRLDFRRRGVPALRCRVIGGFFGIVFFVAVFRGRHDLGLLFQLVRKM